MSAKSGEPIIDVVIPVKNGLPEIQECIQGLLAQSLAPRRIIAIDSGSNDGTCEYLRTVPMVDIIRIDSSQFNHGLTRNIGWKHSDADLIFYTVQDAKAHSSQLLCQMADGFSDSTVWGVCGSQIVCRNEYSNPMLWHRPIDLPIDQRYQLTASHDFDACTPTEKQQMCGWDNVVAMYRRTALQEAPFRDVSFGEDMLWASDALRKGATLLYRPSATVCHHHLEDRKQMMRRLLSTLYFRHLHFGYLETIKPLTWKGYLRLLRHVALNRQVPFNRRWYWFTYNIQREKAAFEAWELFRKSILIGGNAMESLYKEWVAMPPIPLKRKQW
ncbi:MAG: glycosyltransferase family 2 protein [Bacteroidetes bacterium]|nr:glycosyltransferase family 2 protein [Bacteroidota bacterium]